MTNTRGLRESTPPPVINILINKDIQYFLSNIPILNTN